MNSCEHYQELISRLVDADVSREEYDELLEHMNTCSRCSALYAVFYDLSEIIGSEEPVELPEGLHENIMAGVRRSELEKKNRRARSVWRRTALTAAACAALILFAVKGFSPTEQAENAVVRSEQAAEELLPAEEAAAPETAAAAGETTPAPTAEAKPTPTPTPTPVAAAVPEESSAPESPIPATASPAPTQHAAALQTEAPAAATAAPKAPSVQNATPVPTASAPAATIPPTPTTPAEVTSTTPPAATTPATPAPVSPVPASPAPEKSEGSGSALETAAPATPAAASPEPEASSSPAPVKEEAEPDTVQAPAPTASIQVKPGPLLLTASEEPTLTQSPSPERTETESPAASAKPSPAVENLADTGETSAPAAANADAVEATEKPAQRRIMSMPRLTMPMLTAQDQEILAAPEVSESPAPSAEPKAERRESLRIAKDENRQKLQILLAGREASIPDGTPDKTIEVTLIPSDAYGSEEKLTIRIFETEVYYQSAVNGESKSFAAACSPAELEALLKSVSADETSAPSASPSALPSATPTPAATPDPYLETPAPADSEQK